MAINIFVEIKFSFLTQLREVITPTEYWCLINPMTVRVMFLDSNSSE